MSRALGSKINDWLLDHLGRIPVLLVIPVSIAIAIVIGGLVPALLHLDRVLSGLYAVFGAVVGWMPLFAVLDTQRRIDERRLLLLRNGYAEGIGGLSASEFEHLIAAWYESQHYRVTVTGRSGDRGIDVRARRDAEKLAVQCKHWRTKQVGAREVRELRGSVVDRDIKPVLVTSGTFTEAARREARDKGVELLDGSELITRLNQVIAEWAPFCPDCNGLMRPKDGRHGTFWSCLNYPTCRGSRDIDARRAA
jgi:hypothetical protein